MKENFLSRKGAWKDLSHTNLILIEKKLTYYKSANSYTNTYLSLYKFTSKYCFVFLLVDLLLLPNNIAIYLNKYIVRNLPGAIYTAVIFKKEVLHLRDDFIIYRKGRL